MPRPASAIDHPAASAAWTRRAWLTVMASGAAVTARSQATAPGATAGSLVEIVAALRPSVLPVGTYDPTASPRFGFRGTGFAVGDGQLVVTNFHVLPPPGEPNSAKSLMVQVPRERRELEPRAATVVATDRVHDLALLRIEGAPVPALALGEAELVPEGSSIVLTGFPVGGALGFSPVSHRGMVAAVTGIALPAPTAQRLSSRALGQLRDGSFDIYQLDATAFPGNSGGPVVDVATGRVIGVVNMVLIRGTRESALSHPTGITYAIPVRFVRELMEKR
jgi:S1-C subfamily serine protease